MADVGGGVPTRVVVITAAVAAGLAVFLGSSTGTVGVAVAVLVAALVGAVLVINSLAGPPRYGETEAQYERRRVLLHRWRHGFHAALALLVVGTVGFVGLVWYSLNA